jgi:hypothetical protein
MKNDMAVDLHGAAQPCSLPNISMLFELLQKMAVG